jgi:hypothetical protein
MEFVFVNNVRQVLDEALMPAAVQPKPSSNGKQSLKQPAAINKKTSKVSRKTRAKTK